MKKGTRILLQMLMATAPLIYLFTIWNQLPVQIPMHYNAQFEVDRYGTKPELLGLLIVFYLITVATALLITNLNKIDPKKKFVSDGSEPSALLIKISWTLTVFLTLIAAFIVFAVAQQSNGGEWFSPKFLLVLIALLYTTLGNFMNNLKPNYFVGIRTPWNLEDETNWRKTHHLASKVWFFGGIIIGLLILLAPRTIASYILIIGTMPLALIPIYYSWSLFQKGTVAKDR